MLQGSQLHCIGFPAHWTAFLWLNVEPGVDQQCETKQQKCQNDILIFPCLRQVACHQLPLQILQPGVQTHGLRFQSRPRPTARLLGGMIAKSSHKSQIHPLPGNSTESVLQSESARQMVMKNKWFQRQLDVSASNSQMRQDKITLAKKCSCFKTNFTITKMFQPQFHYQKRSATQVSESISKSQSEKQFLLQNPNRHNPRTKDVSESAPIKDRFVSESTESKITVKEHTVLESGVSKITIKTNLFRIAFSNNTIKKQFALFQTQMFS